MKAAPAPKVSVVNTEIGPLPDDWQVVRLDSIGRVKGGKRLPLGKSLTDKMGEHPYIRVSDMRDGSVDQSKLLYVPDEVFPLIKNYTISSDELFISVAGTLGLIGRVPLGLNGANLTENADKITDLRCERDYLYFCLNSQRIQFEIDTKRTVGAQPKLAIQQIEAFRIPMPPSIEEQQHIARTLTDIDDLIASLDALIAKKRDIKQAAMQQLLTGRTRLPGFEGEWLRVPVGLLGKWRGGATPSMRRREFWEGGNIPWASSADVRIGPIESTSSAITERAVRESSTTLLPPGSIAIVTRSGILRRFLPVGLTTRPTAINQDIKAVFPNPRFSSEFVFHALVAASDEILASCLKSGTTVESIEFPWLKRFEVEVPEDRAEQDAISLFLTEMDQEVDALTAKQAKAAELKEGMMQQLLTGRIRLV